MHLIEPIHNLKNSQFTTDKQMLKLYVHVTGISFLYAWYGIRSYVKKNREYDMCIMILQSTTFEEQSTLPSKESVRNKFVFSIFPWFVLFLSCKQTRDNLL